MYDTIATRRHWAKYPVDLLHHCFALFLCGGALYTNTGLQEAPFFSLLEMSTVLVNITWMMRELDKKGHANRLSYKVLSIAFAILFGSLRVYAYGKRIIQYETGFGIEPGSEYDVMRSVRFLSFQNANLIIYPTTI